MRKNFYLTVILLLISYFSYSQNSVYHLRETTMLNDKYSGITIYHSSGYLYHFQTSFDYLFFQKLNASSLAFVGTGKSAYIQGIFMVTGGFEDQSGDIIIFGRYLNGPSSSFILKFRPSTNTIVKMVNTDFDAIKGCWGQKNYGLGNQAYNYCFVSENMTVRACDTSLVLNNKYLFPCDQGFSDISWNDSTKKYMVSGTKGDTTCFISFYCVDSSANFYNICHKVKYRIPNLTSYASYSKSVLHTKLNDGKILISHIGRIDSNHTVALTILTPTWTYPYNVTINQIKTYSFGTGSPLIQFALLNNVENNKSTLCFAKIVSGSTYNYYHAPITVASNSISLSYKYFSTDSYMFGNLINNPVDEDGSVQIITGLYTIGTYAKNGALHYLHNHTDLTQCFTIPGKIAYSIKTTTIDSICTYSLLSPSTQAFQSPLPTFVNNTFARTSICNPYHSFGSPTFKGILAVTEFDVVILENKEFLLKGFTGKVLCNLYDVTGKMVYSIESQNDINNIIPELSNGMYILKVKDEVGNQKTIKFFK